MYINVPENLNEAMTDLQAAIANDKAKASEIESRGVTVVLELVSALRHIAPADTDGRSELRAWTYASLNEKTGKKYFNLAMNGQQKEWFLIDEADEGLAEHFAEHGVKTLGDVKRLAEAHPRDGGTQRGFDTAAAREESQAARKACRARYEAADPEAKLALFASDAFGSDWSEVVTDLADAIREIREAHAADLIACEIEAYAMDAVA